MALSSGRSSRRLVVVQWVRDLGCRAAVCLVGFSTGFMVEVMVASFGQMGEKGSSGG